MLFSTTSNSGIFRAVRSADKLIKAHCFPLEWTLKRSWWISAERNKAILTCIFLGNICVIRIQKYKTLHVKPEPMEIDVAKNMRAQHKILFELTPHFSNWLGDCEIPPELRHPDRQKQIEISTIHSSEQKTGSSELWRILITSRIVCCLADARQQ